ncbi:hypothetical protein BN844_4122 [Pseudomonas sp. SHC52]|nr:hypothetical protein BN844_4122 [Pseudomonas sp. SHC52]
MTTGCHKAGNRDERSKGRDQALHGEILENALIAPEYTGHPAACLCNGAPVRRGWWPVWSVPGTFRGPRKWLSVYPLQSSGSARILRRLSMSRHFRGCRNEFD